MLKELCFVVIFGSLSVWASNPNLKNGPSGWQQFKPQGRSGFESKHHKGSRNEDFEGSYSGSSATGNAAGRNMKANRGSNKADATMDRDKANAVRTGNNFEADRNGRKAIVHTDGSSNVKKATAGKHEIDANVNKGSKTVNANNQNGRGKWNADLKGSTGNAVDKDSRKSGKIQGIKRGTSKVQASSKGKKVLAGKRSKGSSKASYARVPGRFGGKQQYTAQEQGNRREARTRIVKGRRTALYQSSVKSDNSAAVLQPNTGKRLASIKINKYKEIPCQKFPDRENAFAESNKDFEYYEKSLTVDVPKKGGGYEWPSCMDVKAKFKIPPGIKMEDLAASLTVLMPTCGHLQCGQEHKCLGLECFYKDLCGDPNAKPSQTHKDASSWILSQTTTDACKKPIGQNRDVDLVFHYCPDPNGKWNQKACVKDTLSTLSVASMEVQVDVYTVNKRPMKCSAADPKNLKNVVKRGCRRVELDYSVKWLNLPDLNNFVKPLSKVTRGTDCTFGKGMCVGTKSQGLGGLSNIFGGGRKNTGSSSSNRGRGGNSFTNFFGGGK